MVVVSGEGMQLLPCSSSQNKHVIIYYPNHDKEFKMRGFLVCVPVDRLIHGESPSSEVDRNFEPLELPRPWGEYFSFNRSCIGTPTTRVGGGERTSPGLYFLGGQGEPPENCHYELPKEYVLKKVYKYDLHKLPKVGNARPCTDMIYGISRPLVAQVGDDFIFVLSHGKAELSDTLKPSFQKYKFKEGVWVPLSSDQFVDMINNCDCDEQLRGRLNGIPHVVIGRYLHVSIGNSSFTYDTIKNVWEDCKLFENFWSEREDKSGFSPAIFYGGRVWDRATNVAVKKRKIVNYSGGPPFGFCGRGILWNGNILLGNHYGPNCPLVAFLFDDKTGRVVRSQRLCLDKLVFNTTSLLRGARLLHLGGHGYFCLVHFLPDKNIEDSMFRFQIELVTFQVSRMPKQTAATPDDGHGDDDFVDCKFVRKEFVAKICPNSIGHCYDAFCV